MTKARVSVELKSVLELEQGFRLSSQGQSKGLS